MNKYVFGVDLGGTTVKIGLFDEDGTLIEKTEIPTDKSENGKNILNDISKKLDEILVKENIYKTFIDGVGICVPGPVDSDGIVHGCVNLGWGKTDVKKEFEALSGFETFVGNDANAAALGEMWQGSGKGFNDMIFVTIGTGVGSGIIVNGKMITGFNGSAGELGHVTVFPEETESCNCGKKGCVEQYGSATGMVKEAEKLIYKENLPSVLKDKKITAKSITDAAKSGDRVALMVIDKMGFSIGSALGHVGCILNPQAVIVGGGVSNGGEIILNAIEKYYKKYTFHTATDIHFAIAKLGNDAGMYGAAKLAFE